MKPVWMMMAGLAAASALALAEELSVIRFANRDKLSGSLVSLGADVLVWDSPILSKPTPFFTREVTELTLPAKIPKISANHEATVKLTNGDVLRGQLAAVTAATVELDTWFAGRMSFPRPMVQDLEIRELPKIIYQGPGGMENWTVTGGEPGWIYQSNGFSTQSSSSIAADLALPETCSISFDVEWRSSLRFKMIFFSKDTEASEPESGYDLTFQRRSVRLSKSGDHQWIGHTTAATQLQENEKAQIEIRSNLKTGQFAFFVDGKMVDLWTDGEMNRENLGGGVHFITEDAVKLRISNIRVGIWDGVLDEMPGPKINGKFLQDEDEQVESPQEENPELGRIRMRNGDHMAGEVVAIHQGEITVKTPFAEVKLPISRLKNFPLTSSALEKAIRRKGDVRAWFFDGSSVVFQLQQTRDGIVQGTSQNFGSAAFKMEAFTRMEFNIHRKELQELGLSQPPR